MSHNGWLVWAVENVVADDDFEVYRRCPELEDEVTTIPFTRQSSSVYMRAIRGVKTGHFRTISRMISFSQRFGIVLLVVALQLSFVTFSPAQDVVKRTILFQDAATVPPSQIYTVNQDGTGLKRLTTDEDYETDPQWSPDGQQIAFINFVQGGSDNGHFPGQLFTVDRDGANRRLLVDLKPGRRGNRTGITGFAWSPGGDVLAVTELNTGLLAIETSGVARLIVPWPTPRELNQTLSSPAWSPDGTKIAFYVASPGSAAIHVVNADGSNDRQISVGAFDNERRVPISWSADSKELCFGRVEAGLRGPVIHVAAADGTYDRPLIGFENEPSVIFSSPVISHDGRAVVRATVSEKDPGEPSPLIGSDPVFSPDGRRIIFTHVPWTRPPRNNQIYIVNDDGSGLRQLTNDPAWACSAGAWSSDGSQVVFSCGLTDRPRPQQYPRLDWRIFMTSPDNPALKLTPLIDREARFPAFAP